MCHVSADEPSARSFAQRVKCYCCAGAVSFAQIVKACEPVYVALLCLVVPPIDIKPAGCYAMLSMIVFGVGMACVKEGKGK